MKDWDKGFICGIAISAAFLIKGHDEPTMAKEMIDEFGYKFQAFVNAGVEEQDLEELRKLDWSDEE